MTDKKQKSHGERREGAPYWLNGEFVSFTDTKTVGPTGVLDG